ncbi:MAG: hypothetical protein HQ556_13170 [Candidatus Marinimicrobia bacterium]|nr:hypothetical protein [Candidatus Neomarinimicrobiota bacterium]
MKRKYESQIFLMTDVEIGVAHLGDRFYPRRVVTKLARKVQEARKAHHDDMLMFQVANEEVERLNATPPQSPEAKVAEALKRKAKYAVELDEELDRANEVIEELYSSGCLDTQRENIVKEYLGITVCESDKEEEG